MTDDKSVMRKAFTIEHAFFVGGQGNLEIEAQKAEELREDALLAKADAAATREFVLEHLHALRGHLMPLEILSIQNLPGHSCLIVNDHFLLSYVEAEQLIRSLNVRSHADI